MTNHRKHSIDLLLLMTSRQLEMSQIPSYVNSMHKMILIRRSIYKEKSELHQ